MNRRTCLAVLCGAACDVGVAHSQEGAFVWRVADITAQVVRDSHLLKIGQYLELRQSLRSGESGWVEMKIDLPESWKVLRVATEGDSIAVVVEAGPTTFRLNRRNVGALSFRILDGNRKWTDSQLDSIWREMAMAKE
jgi:hypothetical protein